MQIITPAQILLLPQTEKHDSAISADIARFIAHNDTEYGQTNTDDILSQIEEELGSPEHAAAYEYTYDDAITFLQKHNLMPWQPKNNS